MASDPFLMSPTSPIHRDDSIPPIFALVIGINTYASEEYKNLTAAVGDADRFERYLLESLNVPPSHITSLRDETATRAAIIAAFRNLRDDIRFIRDEAAIIIYFAGHGARTDKPIEWNDWETTGEQIEMMCSADIGVTTENADKPEEKCIPGIPDRTVSVLLNHISDVKGDNITMILDCCSSGGINRADSQVPPGYVPRQIYNPPSIHPDCDRQIVMRETRSAGTAQGFSGKYHGSHVLLAACGRDQVAWEDPKTGHGMFTEGLLKTIKLNGVNELTYTGLMHKLNMPRWQTPHCEGQHVSRRLFNKRASGADGSFILCNRNQSDKSLVLRAGAAQGITVGSTFGIYRSNLVSDHIHPNIQLGTLVIESVAAFSSTFSTTQGSSIPKSSTFYCKLLERKAEKLTIYCEDRTWVETVFQPDVNTTLAIELVDQPEVAALRISLIDGKVHFERNDPMITPHVGLRIPHIIEQDNTSTIREVVRCIIHFRYHLTRAGDGFKNVWMELRKLKTDYSKDFDQTLTPIEENLIDKEPATIVVDEFARLGMSIYNQTDLPLYPYLFYFDPSDLVIIEWYTPPFGAGAGRLTTAVDAPLPPKSHLTIGYGEGGVSPWQFLLREGEDKDVGFFKLFLTTSPADFSSITQESPFETSISRYGKPAPPKLPEAEKWGSQLATIIQLRS